MYATIRGRVLRRSEALRSCGVVDGSTDQVTIRMLKGQEGQDGEETRKSEPMRGKVEQKGAEHSEIDRSPVIQEDAVIQHLETTAEHWKIIGCVSDGSERETEQKVRNYLAEFQKLSWFDKDQLKKR